jgi:hypothetical protein
MKKNEKKLSEKLIFNYKNADTNRHFTLEENLILESWRATGKLNNDAFHDNTAGNGTFKQYIQGIGYPFSNSGEEERKKSWYRRFRDNMWIIIFRDAMTGIAFVLSAIISILTYIKK